MPLWPGEVVGRLYSILSMDNLKPLTTLKHQWEEELDTEISDELWQAVLNNIHSSSICLRHTIIQFKVTHRLHWSKAKLARIAPDIDPECDRCNIEPGTLSHMFFFLPLH